jgi:hypothetical protein
VVTFPRNRGFRSSSGAAELKLMGSRLIIAGIVLGCLALLMLVAGSSGEASDPVRSFSLVIIPMALLLVAGGVYANARGVLKTVENISNTLKGQGTPGNPCARCRQDRALMYCTSHGQPLCLSCMTSHDAKTCVYVPMFRTASTPTRRAAR